MIETITIKKPIKNTLPPVIDKMFAYSLAVSEAVGEFWKLGLSKSAELGEVRESPEEYQIDIIY